MCSFVVFKLFEKEGLSNKVQTRNSNNRQWKLLEALSINSRQTHRASALLPEMRLRASGSVAAIITPVRIYALSAARRISASLNSGLQPARDA
jgi:hypothetical protein